jgi:hypothetical protein
VTERLSNATLLTLVRKEKTVLIVEKRQVLQRMQDIEARLEELFRAECLLEEPIDIVRRQR